MVWAVEIHLFQTIALGGGTTVEEEGEEVKRVGVARVGLLEVGRLLLGTCMIERRLMGLLSGYRAGMEMSETWVVRVLALAGIV